MSTQRAKQLPGCLPKGYSLDSLLTPQQFMIWRGVKRTWWSAHGRLMPGVVKESRGTFRVHPRTYLEKQLKTTITATT